MFSQARSYGNDGHEAVQNLLHAINTKPSGNHDDGSNNSLLHRHFVQPAEKCDKARRVRLRIVYRVCRHGSQQVQYDVVDEQFLGCAAKKLAARRYVAWVFIREKRNTLYLEWSSIPSTIKAYGEAKSYTIPHCVVVLVSKSFGLGRAVCLAYFANRTF